ncbi:MAG: hypothetical protein ABSG38_01980 [Spirochaetia bacterium]|jgi:hypothetical protein
MRESTKAVLRRRICFGSLLVVMASVAACSMSGTSGNQYSPGGTSGGSSGGPPYTVTYRNTTAYTTGSVPVDSTQYAANATVTVKGNTGTLSWPGYSFTGWDTADSGSDGGGGGGTFYAPGATFTITSNVVLYGTWYP